MAGCGAAAHHWSCLFRLARVNATVTSSDFRRMTTERWDAAAMRTTGRRYLTGSHGIPTSQLALAFLRCACHMIRGTC